MPSFSRRDRDDARDDREPTRACREHNVRSGGLSCASALVALSTLVACGAPSSDDGAQLASDEPSLNEARVGDENGEETASAPRVVTPTESGDAPSNGAPSPSPSLAAQLLAKTKSCAKVSKSPYANNSGGSATVDICGLTNAVYWRADLDVDCDGKSSSVCNSSTDPWYQPQTAATDSKGEYLDAATLPYVVVPGVSTRWSYKSSGIAMGSVVAVIHDDKVVFGVVGDIGPTSAIGEASYAMAKSLGIDPNPKTGGIGSGVTYVVFTGTSGVVGKKEDHAEASALGMQRAKQLLAEN